MQQEQQTEDALPVSAPSQAMQGRSLGEIVAGLNSARDEEREAAEQAFRALIERDLKTVKRGRWVLYGIGGIYCLAGFAALMQMLVFSHIGLPLEMYVPLLFAATLGPLTWIGVQQHRVGRRLATLDTPQAVGPLVDVLATMGLSSEGDIQKALVRLLPRLKASDAKWLNLRQRKYLLRFLANDEWWPYRGRFWGADLKIAVLKALEQIGDPKAIAVVESLGKSSKNEAVRRAAQECLPFLRERVQQVRIEQSLLRASSPTLTTETLLRPASGSSNETEPEQLLRPTSE